jgi:uncharacterized protein (PEP-CTERM system associated)
MIFVLCQRPLFAKDWLFSPSLTAGEIFTDNVDLTATNKQTAFVTEISPGISVSRSTDRVKLNLDYKLQNLFNASNSQNNSYHIFDFETDLQLVNNLLFLDARANSSQQSINNNILSNSNVTGRLNRTNVTSYGFSPILKPHFNGYAEGDIRFNYDEIKIDSSALSDTTRTEEIINIVSDKRFYNNVGWRVTYNNRDEQRSGGNNVKFQNAEAEARLKINRELNVFSLVGVSDNNFQTITNSYKNGAYYTVGAQWKPMRQFSIEAGYGTNSHVTLSLMPFRNVSWETTFRNRGVGTNVGNIWQTDFVYKAKRTDLNINYLEDTTSSQGALLGQTYAAQNIYQQFTSPINYNLPTLSNELYIRKRANAIVDYRSGKSVFSTKLYDERRVFQVSGIKEEVTGIVASWNWHFTHTMDVYISPLWQHTSRFNSSDVRKDIAIGLSRVIPIKFDRAGGMNAILEYRHTNQDSDLLENSFDENRLTANLLIAF